MRKCRVQLADEVPGVSTLRPRYKPSCLPLYDLSACLTLLTIPDEQMPAGDGLLGSAPRLKSSWGPFFKPTRFPGRIPILFWLASRNAATVPGADTSPWPCTPAHPDHCHHSDFWWSFGIGFWGPSHKGSAESEGALKMMKIWKF